MLPTSTYTPGPFCRFWTAAGTTSPARGTVSEGQDGGAEGAVWLRLWVVATRWAAGGLGYRKTEVKLEVGTARGRKSALGGQLARLAEGLHAPPAAAAPWEVLMDVTEQ